MIKKYLYRAIPLLTALCLVIALSVPVSAASDPGTPIDISDSIKEVSFVGDEAYVTYDVPLDPFSIVYGQKVGEDTTSHILNTTYIQLFQDSYTTTFFTSFYEISELSLSYNNSYACYFAQGGTTDALVDVYDQITHVIINGVFYEVTAFASGSSLYLSTFASDNTKPSQSGEYLVRIIRYTSSTARVGVYSASEETLSVSLVYHDTVINTDAYEFIYGSTYPLGWYSSNIKVIDVSDLRSGSSFDVTFDYRFSADFEGTVSGGGLQFYAVFFDQDWNAAGTMFFEELDFTATASSSRYTTSFVLPEGAEYFYIYVDLDSLNVLECKSYEFVMTDLDLTVAMSSVEYNSKQMDLIEEKLDEIISGGEAGEDLIAGGDRLENAGAGLGDDIGAIQDFENVYMGQLEDNLDDIIAGADISMLSASLSFVQIYLDKIVDGVPIQYIVVFTLPFLIGLFMYIVGHPVRAPRPDTSGDTVTRETFTETTILTGKHAGETRSTRTVTTSQEIGRTHN